MQARHGEIALRDPVENKSKYVFKYVESCAASSSYVHENWLYHTTKNMYSLKKKNYALENKKNSATKQAHCTTHIPIDACKNL